MQPPKISVIMPVWNGEAYLATAIDSILVQTWTDFEFIILDDGSTDRSPEIIADYANKDSRIRVIRLDHQGIVIALNRGVAEAHAEWIARMDCDDIAHPERLQRQCDTMRKHPEAVLCHTHIRLIGDHQSSTPLGRFIRTRSLLALRLCYQSPIAHPSVMFKKETFLACGEYQQKERHAEDFSLWGRMLVAGDVIGIAEPLLDFRVHSNSISKQMNETQMTLSRDIAIGHCMSFMSLDEITATRAYRTLCRFNHANVISEWIWFVTRCLPKLRWKSFEMWAWIVSRSIQVATFEIKKKFAR